MSESEAETWIAWHCNIQGNEFLCEVDEDYIRDKFNLTGLSDLIPHYREAIDIILDEFADESDNDVDVGLLEKEASALYGLIHSRYILTSDGIKDMIEKWNVGHFGKCQNIFCKGQKCLPIGLNPNIGNEYVKIYCPSCQNIYNPQRPSNMLDGGYIGPNFPHMLLMMHPELRPKRVTLKVEPKLFGFKIHPLAYSQK